MLVKATASSLCVKLDADLAPATILNGLSIVRRIFNLALRDDIVRRNPASGSEN